MSIRVYYTDCLSHGRRGGATRLGEAPCQADAHQSDVAHRVENAPARDAAPCIETSDTQGAPHIKFYKSHELLGILMRLYEGIDIAEELAFSEEGKPYLTEHPGVYFSITHTGNIWMCAVSDDRVGLDAEFTDRRIDEPVKLARRFFSERESAYVAGELRHEACGTGYSCLTSRDAEVCCVDLRSRDGGAARQGDFAADDRCAREPGCVAPDGAGASARGPEHATIKRAGASDACCGQSVAHTGGVGAVSPDAAAQMRFMDIWTKREAYAKYKGMPLLRLRDFCTFDKSSGVSFTRSCFKIDGGQLLVTACVASSAAIKPNADTCTATYSQGMSDAGACSDERIEFIRLDL